MVILGQGWDVEEPSPHPPEPLPDPILAVLEAVALLREGLNSLPAPVVHVQPQDLSDIVTAVQGLNGPYGPSANEIAAAIRAELLPALTHPPDEGWQDRLITALESLDFRMKGMGGTGGVGGTVATISTISDVVRTKPEPGYTWPVSGTVTASTTDNRTLTERMLAKAPASGYHLWLDVTSTDSTHIYTAEAPDGTSAATASFRGIRLTLDASGNPLGAVETATGFAWDSRASATWTS